MRVRVNPLSFTRANNRSADILFPSRILSSRFLSLFYARYAIIALRLGLWYREREDHLWL